MNDPFDIPDEILDNLPVAADFRFPYPAALPHDVALASLEDLPSVLQHHNLTEGEYAYIESSPEFRRELAEWRARIVTEGYGLRIKARALAEDYLPKLYGMMLDDKTAPSVRLESHKHLVALAGLSPKDAPKGESAGGQQSTKLIIQWGGEQGQIAMEVKSGE
jgi:hypothetical protein